MATGTSSSTTAQDASRELADQWRRLRRAATIIAVLTSPAAFVWFHQHVGYSTLKSAVLAFLAVITFRGMLDLLLKKVIPWPSLFGTDDKRLREDDVVAHRRAWTWHRLLQLFIWFVVITTIIWIFRGGSWVGATGAIWHKLGPLLSTSAFWTQIIFVFFLFIANFAILMGPMLMMGISQIRGFEPGDAQWGVKLEDVRGQQEAKEEVRRVVNLWQSGEAFEKAGGKRERGLMFLGAPGTGKTMLAKAIATGFNSPFVSIPGSGFAQTFIGIDAIIVRFLSRKAKKLARKWGGTCIVFIDEIDAVGMRRSALGGAGGSSSTPGVQPLASVHDVCFYGPWGALTASGDVIKQGGEWRERVFAARAEQPAVAQSGLHHRLNRIVDQAFPGMMGGMGGGLALNQLLVTMDGMDNPPFLRRVLVNKINTILDAIYVVPRRIGKLSLRLPPPPPRKEQVYFIGATNVPLEVLDPALIRPGRMGRHVWFRTPTKDDRKDVFDLYLAKVGHEPELDTPAARDELARMTNGYSPAMIDQVCSMALTHAQHDGRMQFSRQDLVEAMTTIEAGTAIGVEHGPDRLRAIAVHEAGHAVTSYLWDKNSEATRLTIKMRGSSHGHLQLTEKEEQFGIHWRSEFMSDLTMTLGAMAAEYAFYGENGNGVGGDLQSVTSLAASMVGQSGMGPEPFELSGTFADESAEESRERVEKRFEKIGIQIMNRTASGGGFAANPMGSVLSDRDKRANAAQIIGQAFVRAYNTIQANREGMEHIVTVLLDKREMYGDEVVHLLEQSDLKLPQYDLLDEKAWPTL
jgi:ATP-dependent Zn protease